MNHRRVILVTGAAQNIGAAIGTRFLEQGATVICADLRPPANSDLEFIETGWSEGLAEALLLRRHALHATGLSVPWEDGRMEWSSPLPDELRRFVELEG